MGRPPSLRLTFYFYLVIFIANVTGVTESGWRPAPYARQLGDVRSDPSRLILAEQLGCRESGCGDKLCPGKLLPIIGWTEVAFEFLQGVAK
jgi:hypothetical protein